MTLPKSQLQVATAYQRLILHDTHLTVSQKVEGSNPSSSTLEGGYLLQLTEGFILTCRVEGKSPATIKFYKGITDKFFWYLNEFKITNVNAMTVRGFLGYLQSAEHRWGSSNSRAKRKAGQVTLQRYYTGLKVFFNWCLAEVYIDYSPMATLRKPKAPQKVVEAISNSNVENLLNTIKSKDLDSVRNRAMVLLFLDSGLRLSELANLKPGDVKSEVLTVLGKGGKWRVVRVGRKARKALWEYTLMRGHICKNEDTLWVTRRGLPLTSSGIGQVIRQLGRTNGINVSAHKLRHTFATLWLRNGGDSLMLQRLLGHTTLMMTNRYLQAVGCLDALEAHKKYSPMDNL